MLVTLLAVPLLVVAYRRLLRRRDARRSELAAHGLLTTGGTSQKRRSNVAPTLLLVAVALLLLATARPEAVVAEPRRQGTVVLAFDVSTSMAATDVSPTRMEAAKAAARRFVERQPSTVRIGVVAFGESGLVTQPPTAVQADVLAAVDRLTPQGGTALARGIQTSLGAIAGKPVQLDVGDGSLEAQGQDIGYFRSAAIVLLSDGENTVAADPQQAAEVAATAGVRIYSIGLGRPEPTVLQVAGFSIATALDEPVLRALATTTDGRYYPAADERELADVYETIELEWTTSATTVEVTGLLAACAAVLLLAAAVVSLARVGRVI